MPDGIETIQREVERALKSFEGGDLLSAGTDLLDALGYRSTKRISLGGNPQAVSS